MSMMEYFEMGYHVVLDMVECYEEDSAFDHVDEESHVVYFVDTQDYDEQAERLIFF